MTFWVKCSNCSPSCVRYSHALPTALKQASLLQDPVDPCSRKTHCPAQQVQGLSPLKAAFALGHALPGTADSHDCGVGEHRHGHSGLLRDSSDGQLPRAPIETS